MVAYCLWCRWTLPWLRTPCQNRGSLRFVARTPGLMKYENLHYETLFFGSHYSKDVFTFPHAFYKFCKSCCRSWTGSSLSQQTRSQWYRQIWPCPVDPVVLQRASLCVRAARVLTTGHNVDRLELKSLYVERIAWLDLLDRVRFVCINAG